MTIQEKNWKEKYFDSLKELDQRERSWRRIENLLRSGVNRLATLSQDGHQELDKNLHKIRSLARGTDNIDALEKAFSGLKNDIGATPDSDQDDVLDAIQTVGELLPMDGDHRAAIDLYCKRSDAQKALKVLIKSIAVSFKQDSPIGDSTLAATLLSLLTQLDASETDKAALGQMQKEISQADSARQWQIIIEKLIDQVRVELTSIHDKKKKLLLFIKQLAEQLSGMEKLALSATENMQRAKQRAAGFNNSLSDELIGLSQEVIESDDISKLKHRLSRRLTSALDNMQSYFARESEYFEEAEKTSRSLCGNLQAARQEADELRRELQQSQQAQFLDALTGVPNRHAYQQRFSRELERHAKSHQPLIYALWDIDLFKVINDTYGHNAGDVVLKMVAQLLCKSVREADFMARIGGEEFVVLLPNTPVQEALVLADAIREDIAKSGFNYKGQAVSITASCGLACIRPGDDAEALYERADAALYRAKNEGRNLCCVDETPGSVAA